MPSSRLPERWEKYSNMGRVIPGTRIVAFKVPLNETLCKRYPDDLWFTPDTLIETVEADGNQLGLIIDLTFTTRYYDYHVFTERGINYEKIFVPGKEVPSADITEKFSSVIDNFVSDPGNEGKLVGVHCTHGVNRTGHLVCRYMIDRLNIKPDDAIEGAGVLRAYDSIREVTQMPEANLQMPNLIRTSNMRKYMATMLQALDTTEAERQWVIDHLGHTMDVHRVHYRQTSDVLERVDVAKILLIQDMGLVSKYRGKRLQDIQLEAYGEARGYPIERENYLEDLRNNLRDEKESVAGEKVETHMTGKTSQTRQKQRHREDEHMYSDRERNPRSASHPKHRDHWESRNRHSHSHYHHHDDRHYPSHDRNKQRHSQERWRSHTSSYSENYNGASGFHEERGEWEDFQGHRNNSYQHSEGQYRDYHNYKGPGNNRNSYSHRNDSRGGGYGNSYNRGYGGQGNSYNRGYGSQGNWRQNKDTDTEYGQFGHSHHRK